jgi:hypothetical protein
LIEEINQSIRQVGSKTQKQEAQLTQLAEERKTVELLNLLQSGNVAVLETELTDAVITEQKLAYC